MGFLAGKRAFIVGVATDRSIAWGIAQAMHREGAELAFSYVNDKMKDRVVPLAQSVGSPLVMPLDVTVDEQTDTAFELIKRQWGGIDIVVHAVAFAPLESLTGTYAARRAAHERPQWRAAHALLPRRRALDSRLQRHGSCQGQPGGERALPGGRPGSARRPH
jgi:enoyl-[acyl-carrier protein] reductase I